MRSFSVNYTMVTPRCSVKEEKNGPTYPKTPKTMYTPL
jgi:hypothetical protein